jgi:hypothetical protein
MSRVITVVLKIEDQASAKEFWDAHLARRNIHGCKVVGLAEGDLMQKVEELEDEIDVCFEDDSDDIEII